MDTSIWIKVLIGGNGFALLAFGIGQLLIKGKRAVNYWSFAFFTYSAVTFIYSAVINSSSYTRSPILIWLDFPIVSTAGTLFYFYFSGLAVPERRLSWQDGWLLAPPLFSCLATPLVYKASSDRFYSIAENASNASILWILSCCALFLAHAIRRARENRLGEGRRLRFLIAITFGIIAWAVVFFFSALAGIGMSGLVLASTLFLMAVYFYHLRHPELLSTVPGEVPPIRHGRSKVGGLDLTATIDRLTRTMERDKPYLEEDLSLPALAAKVGLSPHQLSELLNKEMGTTFKAYINRHRVLEARRILRDRPEAKVIDVALDSGFRSKSAFNKLFQEETGVTPTGYRRWGAGSSPRDGVPLHRR